jgi:hypothetical protein
MKKSLISNDDVNEVFGMKRRRNEAFMVARPFRRCRGRDVVDGAKVHGRAGDSSLWTR